MFFAFCRLQMGTDNMCRKHSLAYAIDEIQISDKKWGCVRDKGSKAEPEFNVLISFWGLCWCNFFWHGMPVFLQLLKSCGKLTFAKSCVLLSYSRLLEFPTAPQPPQELH